MYTPKKLSSRTHLEGKVLQDVGHTGLCLISASCLDDDGQVLSSGWGAVFDTSDSNSSSVGDRGVVPGQGGDSSPSSYSFREEGHGGRGVKGLDGRGDHRL